MQNFKPYSLTGKPLSWAKVLPVIIALVVGIGIGGASTKTEVVTKTIPADYSQWRELKEVDDTLLQLAARGFMVVSEAVGALDSQDYTTASAKTAELAAMTGKITAHGNERKTILTKLGY